MPDYTRALGGKLEVMTCLNALLVVIGAMAVHVKRKPHNKCDPQRKTNQGLDADSGYLLRK